MAIVTKLQPYGNNLSVLFSDGSRLMAYESQGVWYVPTGNANGLTRISEYGNQLALHFASGKKALAYPAVSLWYVGPNDEPIPPTPRFIWPFKSDPWDTVPQDGGEYGDRSAWGLPFHNGIDFTYSGIGGAEVHVMGAGTVTISQTWDGTVGSGTLQDLGNYVRVDHGGGLWTGYAHFVNPPSVSVGQAVAQWDVLGYVGDTGFSFGNHLHMETWVGGTRINPRDWMAAYENS